MNWEWKFFLTTGQALVEALYWRLQKIYKTILVNILMIKMEDSNIYNANIEKDQIEVLNKQKSEQHWGHFRI